MENERVISGPPAIHRGGRLPCFTLLAAGILALGALAGCNTTGRPLPEMVKEVNASFRTAEMISPGDVLEVRFPYEPEWTHTSVVARDGTAVFLELDEVLVGGMTVAALDVVLTRGYSTILEKPDLSVRISVPAPRTAVILGEVRQPGNYPVRERYTIFDLIGDAEGFSKRTADLDALLLVRWIPERKEMRSWYIDLDPEWWVCPEPLYIQPFDIVFIPNKPIDKVNIFVDQYIRLMLPFPYLYLPAAP
jgi:protein involved in polysaccharide export with SLBB domain